MPLSQHIGASAIPVVRKGQYVERGELVAEAAENGLSVPIHASVSGTVKDIDLMPSAKGPKTLSIIIETAPSSPQIPIHGAAQDYTRMDRKQIIAAVKETGLVGLGGAGFPSYAKMMIPKDRDIHTVVINGCECEPFLTTDHRIMLEKINDMITGIRIVMKAVSAPKAIIGIENNKLDVLDAIKPHLPTDGRISIEAVETKYPQGAEKMLVKSLLGLEIPSRGLPSEIGLVVFNVATMAELGVLLPNRQGLIERIITVTGDDLKKPGNYIVPIGTPLSHILDYAGFTGEEAELILGGPMMGLPAASLDTPVTKGTGAVLVLDKRATKRDDIQPCIKCSLCLQACPINLNPSELGQLAAKRRYDIMEEKYHLNDCFECGCCSYVCPSNIPLVQYFRIAKVMNRERHIQNG
nr:electron transport complex subunit RsxC [Methylomarinum sp. Ch1-1]MDP4519128.1 electron transport complex subunit RsxC [Methylomarinum sp. Ch1-1]